MIYELRIYHCAPGRLPALNQRFETITLKFWEKYGIQQVGFWSTLVGSSNQTLTYMLQWESLAERETKWNAFASDPEWLAKRAESEAQAIIVERIENQILVPTSYSAMR
ncbi:MAG: NIPSNAP family protein [Glaciimonas sp.]|nr:NIPSNAP family protein [Glaciimonas sp.]